MTSYYKEELKTGTTVLALAYAGGVVMAADTRTTMGSLVANRMQSKLQSITPRVFIARSGSSAVTQNVANKVRYYIESLALEGLGAGVDPALPPTVQVLSIARLLHQIMTANPQLSGAFIVGGVDAAHEEGLVYQIPVGGGLLKVPYATGGSGSAFIDSLMSSQFRPGMSKDEARALALEAVRAAIHSDNSSGGCVRVKFITKAGIEDEYHPFNEAPQRLGSAEVVRENAAIA